MKPSLFSLAGKRALVTGASRGIGQALAVALAEAGADVALVSRSPAHETLAAVKDQGRKSAAIIADMSSPEACQRAIFSAADKLGGLDILVNNAGTEDARPAAEADEALWDRLVDANLKGAFFCATAAARLMLTADSGGSIINLLSLPSEAGLPAAAAGGASKDGLLGATRALAAEWARHGIRVNGIAPGGFRAALAEPFHDSPEWQSAMLAKIPMGRFGHLSDLKGAAVFLASDASSYVTGIVIPVDGGMLASV